MTELETLRQQLAESKAEVEMWKVTANASCDFEASKLRGQLAEAQALIEASRKHESRTFIVSAVLIKENATGVNTQNKLYKINATSADEAEGKIIKLIQFDFPEHTLHTVCHFDVSNIVAPDVLKDAKRYRYLFAGSKVYSQFVRAYKDWDGSRGKDGFDAAIDAAIGGAND